MAVREYRDTHHTVHIKISTQGIDHRRVEDFALSYAGIQGQALFCRVAACVTHLPGPDDVGNRVARGLALQADLGALLHDDLAVRRLRADARGDWNRENIFFIEFCVQSVASFSTARVATGKRSFRLAPSLRISEPRVQDFSPLPPP